MQEERREERKTKRDERVTGQKKELETELERRRRPEVKYVY